jgi:hypothetical protein
MYGRYKLPMQQRLSEPRCFMEYFSSSPPPIFDYWLICFHYQDEVFMTDETGRKD